MTEVTLADLKKILTENSLEFYIKKTKGNIVKVHFYVHDEETS